MSITIELQLLNCIPENKESHFLYDWRNDPHTREMSNNQAIISWEEHCEWFCRVVRNPNTTLLIAQLNHTPIGMIRFDRQSNKAAEISINLAPAFRGKGFGLQLLKTACKYAFENLKLEQLYAEIKPENKASLQIFKKAGFLPFMTNNNLNFVFFYPLD